jgi:hypothetical protein
LKPFSAKSSARSYVSMSGALARARNSYLIIDELQSHGVGKEEDHLVLWVVYRRGRDVYLDAV